MRDITKFLKEATEIFVYNDKDGFQDDTETNANDPLAGGCDVALVGEIRLFSLRNDILNDRKKAIAERYRNEHPSDNDYAASYIMKTMIFSYYYKDVIKMYKEEVDENCKLNVSTGDELKRQLANDIILYMRQINIEANDPA